jgi:hypothetical protein
VLTLRAFAAVIQGGGQAGTDPDRISDKHRPSLGVEATGRSKQDEGTHQARPAAIQSRRD